MTSQQKQLSLLGMTTPIPPDANFQVDFTLKQWQVLMLRLADGGASAVAGRTPVTANVACSSVLATLRNSTLSRVVGLYNHGPNRVHINFGATNAVVDSSSIELGIDDYYETPREVIGQITAICAAAETAGVTVTTL